MRTRFVEIAFGLGLAVIAGGAAVSLWPKGRFDQVFVTSSGFFPLLVAVAVLVAGLCLVVSACQQLSDTPFSIGNPGLLVAIAVASAGYIALLPVLGYAITTVAFVVCVMLLLGAYSWRSIIVLPIALALTLYFVLDVLAGLPLPSGSVFR